MSRRKRKQDSLYTGTSTLAPEVKNSDEERIIKRPKVQHQLKYVPFFNQAMRAFLWGAIKKKLDNIGKKDVKADLEKMKKDLLEAKRLPSGIIKSAAIFAREALSNQMPSSASYLTDNAYRNQLNNESTELLIESWRNYVEKEFSSIVANLQKATEQTDTEQSTSSAVASTPVNTTSVTEEKLYRTCSIASNKVFRKDIPKHILNIIIEKLKDTMINSSNLQAYISCILEMMIILLKKNKFVLKNNRLGMEEGTLEITKLLPAEYVAKNNLSRCFSASPLPADVKETFKSDLDTLFTAQHLMLIYSFFCGPRGSSDLNLLAHPLQNLLFKKLVVNGIPSGSYQQDLQSEEAQNVLSGIITNVENMWQSTQIFNKLLDKLLLVLLKLHLSPKRTNEYKRFTEKKTKSKKKSNRKHQLLYFEKKKLRKFEKKLENVTGAQKDNVEIQRDKSKARLDYLKSLPRSAFLVSVDTNVVSQAMPRTEASSSSSALSPAQPSAKISAQPSGEPSGEPFGETSGEPSGGPSCGPSGRSFGEPSAARFAENVEMEELEIDISRARINAIKSIAKKFLYSKEPLSETMIKKELHQATRKEIETITLVVNSLKDYIPAKEDRFLIAHQLPLCILANDVFSLTNNVKFIRKLFPAPSFSQLSVLKINPVSLYQTLTKAPQPLNIADYSGFRIDSVEFARSNGSAVINSIFNMGTIHAACADANLDFENHVHILPGMKLVRLLGSRLVQTTPEATKFTSATSDILSNKEVQKEGGKSIDILTTEIQAAEALLVEHEINLKKLLKEDNYGRTTNTIREKKFARRECAEEDKKKLTDEINVLKNERFVAHQALVNQRREVSEIKQSTFFKRMALRYHTKLSRETTPDAQQPPRQPLSATEHKLFKTSECLVEDPHLFGFSGTDNGLVNMSTTVPFTAERFKFHLALYNRYQLLQEDNVDIDDADHMKYLDLPKKFVINSADVDIGCGHKKARKRLEREKRKTKQGRKVLKAELALSKSSLNSCPTIQDFTNACDTHLKESKILRKFYSSANRARMSRFIETQKDRYSDTIVNKEKVFLTDANDVKTLVQFVGDRGTGVGSTLKGFRRYGGKWLEELRSKRSTVCITNEHNTSQLCLFCFQKLTHPKGKNQKPIKGSFLCINPACVSVKNGKAAKSRDALSSLAIGISGLSHCLFGTYMPAFSPSKISQFNTDKFKSLSTAFLNEETVRQQRF